MSFLSRFSRRQHPQDATTGATAPTTTTTTTTTTSHPHEKTGHGYSTTGMAQRELGYHNQRPAFGQWLKTVWLDILTMIALGAIGLGVYKARPAPTRSFAVYFQDGQVVYPEFAYPDRKEVVPIWAAAMLAVLVPIVVVLICQIRVRSFWDTSNAVIGLLYSVITAAVFQVFLKWLIGGLRPHFLAVCKPRVTPDGAQYGNGFREMYYTRSICTGDEKKINDSLESFPSGHTTAAFAGFVYLYLYLNAKLKVFSNYHPALWKLVAIYAPILGAVLIGGALTIDEFHNWYDILAGAIIGTVMALSAYRMVYASLFDFRFNHIPLARHIPFNYAPNTIRERGHGASVFTRKAGWGDPEVGMGGAPYDAAMHDSMGIGGALPSVGAATGTGHHHDGSMTHPFGVGHVNQPTIDRRPVGHVNPDVPAPHSSTYV